MTLRARLFAIALIASLPLGGFAAGSERAPRPATKGYELYSWQRGDGAWSFALLPGTNRQKRPKEISEAAADLSKLKRHLSALARDEQVYWVAGSGGSSLPDAGVVAYLKDYCMKLQIELHTSQ